MQNATAGQPTGCIRNQAHSFANPFCPASMGPGNLGYRLEDFSAAGWIPASETPYLQPQLNSTSLPGQVLEATLVLTVAGLRYSLTTRTTNPLANVRLKQKAIIRVFDLVLSTTGLILSAAMSSFSTSRYPARTFAGR